MGWGALLEAFMSSCIAWWEQLLSSLHPRCSPLLFPSCTPNPPVILPSCSPLLSLDGAGTPNPAGQGRTHGGGDYGAAVAVAGGLADLALAVDELGSARVPAACCGAYALRTSAGVLPLEGASTASHSLAAPALLAADPAALLRAGAALRLPGGGWVGGWVGAPGGAGRGRLWRGDANAQY